VEWLFAGPFFILFGLLWLASTVVWIWALVDCVRVPEDSMYESGTKLIWVLIIVLLHVIGAVIYFAIGRPRSGARPATSNGHRPSTLPPAPPAPPGAV
jgi:hypothetical protein